MFLSRLIALRDRMYLRKRRRGYERKIAWLLRGLDGPLATVDADTMSIRKYFPDYRNTDWHTAYATLSGRVQAGYLPEDLFYTVVEPGLNDPAYSQFYRDKICLGFLIPDDDYVGNVFFRNRGHYFDTHGQPVARSQVDQWLATQDEAVIKPSRESGGGRGVVIGPRQEAVTALDETRHGVVIQKLFPQHPDLAVFNPSSLNTIRFMSLRCGGRIHPLSAIYRAGVSGSRVDNVTQGAVGVGIDNGKLRDFGFDYQFGKHTTHPSTGLAYSGHPIPGWDRVVDLVTRCHGRFFAADLVSWDIAIGADGQPRVIEANLREQELNGHQLMNGPIFEPHFESLFGGDGNP